MKPFWVKHKPYSSVWQISRNGTWHSGSSRTAWPKKKTPILHFRHICNTWSSGWSIVCYMHCVLKSGYPRLYCRKLRCILIRELVSKHQREKRWLWILRHPWRIDIPTFQWHVCLKQTRLSLMYRSNQRPNALAVLHRTCIRKKTHLIIKYEMID